MTDTITQLDEVSAGDVQAAIDAGRQTAQPHQLQPGGIYAIATRSGVHQVDLTGDQYQDRPRRTTRKVVVDDISSFVDYIEKHGKQEMEIYANRRALAIEAIIDAPGPGSPDWCQHRLTLQLQHTPSWNAWTGKDCTYMWQVDFAEHIENHLGDIRNPPGAEMLEVAQSLQAITKVSFSSGYRLVDGQRQISYVEETTGTAGAKGTLSIPAEFELGLEVFRGDGTAEPLTARLRYRIKDGGKLSLGYALNDPQAAADRAFNVYAESVATELERPVMAGHVL